MFDSLHKCSFYMIFYTCCKIISINFLVHENLQYETNLIYCMILITWKKAFQ